MFHVMLNLMLRLLVAGLGAVALVLLLNRQPPPLLSQPGFSACALPCWAGVVPGVTDYVASETIIKANVNALRLNFPDFLSEVPTSQITDGRGQVLGAVYEDRGLVGSLRLDFPVPLWHLLEVVGTPGCLVHTHQGADTYIFSVYWSVDDVYIMAMVVVRAALDWRLDQTTTSINIFTGPDPCLSPSALPWQGFGGFNPRRVLWSAGL